MGERIGLRVFRVRRKLSQQEMADVLGVKRSTYAKVELGQRRGSDVLWAKLQSTFGVPDADMWKLMQKEEG